MKRLERERKVLRNKIALAFKEQIEPSLLPENLPSVNPEDTFTETEGERLFAMLTYFYIFEINHWSCERSTYIYNSYLSYLYLNYHQITPIISSF